MAVLVEREAALMDESPPEGVVLGARRLVKQYDDSRDGRPAVDGVDLDIAAGAFLAVMGPSGSGKSTLLHLLGALDTPTSGDVWFEGAKLGDLDDRARTLVRRRRLGFVFQQFNLVPVLNAEENVALPLVIDRVDDRQRRERVAAMLELVGLGAMRTKRPSELSGGEQQRVAIARALVSAPPVVLADEPTGALDSQTGQEILQLFRAAQTELGTTIVMVTHDASAASAADELLRLRDGQVVDRQVFGTSRPAELFADPLR